MLKDIEKRWLLAKEKKIGIVMYFVKYIKESKKGEI